MLGFRLGIIALATAMLPGLCRADITETFLDGGSNLEYTIGGSTPASCGTFLPGGCDVAIFGSGIFPASLDLLINIFEPTGGAISDTMQISTDSAGSELETIFLSNDDGTATLFPYTNGTSITENGKIQTAATVALIGSATGQNFIVQLESAVPTATPEPRVNGLIWFLMLVLALAGARLRVSRKPAAGGIDVV